MHTLRFSKIMGISAAAVALWLTGFQTMQADAKELYGLERISGKDNNEISANISRKLEWLGGKTKTFVLTRDDLFTDALSGTPYAYMSGAPILLTKSASLPDSVRSEIARQQASKVIILGGTGSVTAEVESQLREIGVSEIDRIAGADRFAVSAQIAERMLAVQPTNTVFIASGIKYPDALSASSAAAQKRFPILLVNTDSIPSAIQSFLDKHPEITNFIIVGGPATVSDNVKNALAQRGSVTRIGGLDRYEVAVNIAKHFNMDTDSMVFARGDHFAHALTGSQLDAATKSPVMLTVPTRLPDVVSQFLAGSKTAAMYLVGGYDSISLDVENKLKSHLNLPVTRKEKILFNHQATGANMMDVFMMDPDGSHPVQMTDHINGDSYASISPDGKKIAFASARDGDYEIYVMNVNGTNLVQLTHNEADDLQPDWSPDGTKIAFSRADHSTLDLEKDILVMNADGSNQRYLTQTRNYSEMGPRWSPDGTKIVFASEEGSFYDVSEWYSIYTIKPDGTGKQKIGDVSGYHPSFSPDGKKILFNRGSEGLWVMNSDGTSPKQIYNQPYNPSLPIWSPDGTKIAFAKADTGGYSAIFIMNADGTGAKQISRSSWYTYPTDWGFVTEN